MEAVYGVLIPFLGTSLGAACVFFLKKSLESDRTLPLPTRIFQSGTSDIFLHKNIKNHLPLLSEYATIFTNGCSPGPTKTPERNPKNSTKHKEEHDHDTKTFGRVFGVVYADHANALRVRGRHNHGRKQHEY